MGLDAGNALGRAVGAINYLTALRGGNLQQLAAANALALNNPQVRAGLANRPFQAGVLGLGGQQRALPVAQPIDEYTNLNAPAQPTQVNVPQQFAWQPNLPPLDPATAAKVAQAQGLLDLQQRNPDAFAAIGGYSDPATMGRVVAQGPRDANNQPILQNMVARSGNLTMAQQALPWPYQARNIDQGNLPGEWGNLGWGDLGGGRQLAGGGQGPSGLSTGRPGAVSEQVATEMNRAAGGGTGYKPGFVPSQTGVRPLTPPAAAAPTTAPTAPTPAGKPPEGFQPMTALPSIDAAAKATAPPPGPTGTQQVTPTTPTTPTLPPTTLPPPSPQSNWRALEAGGYQTPQELGYPSGFGTTGGVTPQYGAQAMTPDEVFGPPAGGPPLKSATRQVTTPHGAAGSKTATETYTYDTQRQDLLDRARVKGLSDTEAVAMNAMLLSADAYRNLLDYYAPINPDTGKRDYDLMAKFAGRYQAMGERLKGYIPGTGRLGELPFTGGALAPLDQNPDYQQFRTLVMTLSSNISQFAGKAITEGEKKLFEPFLIGSVDVSEPEFFQRLFAIGRVIGRFGRDNAMLYGPKLPPELRNELSSLGQQFPPERWGLVPPDRSR